MPVRADRARGIRLRIVCGGAVGPTSDLDVLVIRETELGIVERVADLKLGMRGPVDLVVITPQERVSTFAASSFGRTVLSTARRVYAA